MTDVLARVARRAPAAAPPAAPAAAPPAAPSAARTADRLPTLADLPVGSAARVVGFADDEARGTTRRLYDLGFEPGAHVLALRRAPLGDPVVFQVADYEIALRSAQSRSIRIALP